LNLLGEDDIRAGNARRGGALLHKNQTDVLFAIIAAFLTTKDRTSSKHRLKSAAKDSAGTTNTFEKLLI